MSAAAETTLPDGERKFSKCENTLTVGNKLLKLKKAIRFFQGKAELIEPKVAPLIVGEPEVRPIEVPEVDDAQPAAVRAEQMKDKREAEKKLEDRIAKKLDVCVLFKTYSDDSFRDLVETKPLVKTAFNNGDIPVVVELWKEWYNNGPVVAAEGVVNTAKEVAEAAAAFNNMHQLQSESVLEYQTRFNELKRIATTIGKETYTELFLALKIIKGLKNSCYNTQREKMLAEEDRQGKLVKEGMARENLRGHPQSEEKAWAKALDWERDLPPKKEGSKPNKKQKTDPEAPKQDKKDPMKSYASVQKGNGNKNKDKAGAVAGAGKKKIYQSREKIQSYNSKTNPPSKFNYPPCQKCNGNHWYHEKCEDFSGEPQGKDAKAEPANKGKMIGRSSVSTDDMKELLLFMKEEILSGINPSRDQKMSRASVIDSSESIGLDSPRIDKFLSPSSIRSLKAAGVKKMTFKSIYKPGPEGDERVMYMTRYSKEGHRRQLTDDDILIDNCGNVHSIMRREAAKDIRDNPDPGVVNTMAGEFKPEHVCTVPFLGDAFFNDAEEYSVLSQSELMQNDNVWVEDVGNFQMNIHFIPLNVILEAKWTNGVMVANGREYFEAMSGVTDWADLRPYDRVRYLDRFMKPIASPEPLKAVSGYIKAIEGASDERDLAAIRDAAPSRQEVDTTAVSLLRHSASGGSTQDTLEDIIRMLEQRTRGANNDSTTQPTIFDIFGPESPEAKWEGGDPFSPVTPSPFSPCIYSPEGADPPTGRGKSKRKKISRAQLRKLPGPSLPKGLEYLIESNHDDGESDMPELIDFQDDDSDDDEDCQAPEPSPSAEGVPPARPVIMSKKVVEATNHVREMQRRLGGCSVNHIIRSRHNGSVRWKPEYTNALLRAVDKVLRPDASAMKGRYQHPKNIASKAESYIDPSKREVVMQIDYIFDEKLVWLISVIDPIGYVLLRSVNGRGTAEARTALKEMVDHYRKFDITVKVIQCDSEGSFAKLHKDMQEWTGGEVLPAPTGIKLGLLDNVVKRTKQKVRAFRASSPEISFGGVLLNGLYVAAVMCLCLLATSHNPGGQSPLCMLTGEQQNMAQIMKFKPGEAAEASNHVLLSNRTGVDKTQTLIALHPEKLHHNGNTHIWAFYNPETKMVVPRNYGTPVPYTEAMIKAIQADALTPGSNIFCPSAHDAITKKRGRKKDERPISDTAPEPERIVDMEVDIPYVPPAVSTPEPRAGGVATTAGGVEAAMPPRGIPPTPRALPERQNLFDVYAAETLSPDRELMRVEPDGSVAYTCYRRVPPAENEPPFIRINGTVKYSNMKGDMISLASHMGINQATRTYGDLATKALADEVAGFVDRDVWSGVTWSELSKTARKKILRLSTFLKEKFDLFGALIKLKARIVVDGSQEDRSLFKTSDITSPTVALSSVLSVSTVAAAQGRHVVTMDVEKAYLEADMPNEVLVRLQPVLAKLLCARDPSFIPFLDEKGSMIVRLNKAQYGCVESARLWYNTLSSFLVSQGYEMNPYDPCVFNKIGRGGKQITVLIYVDDIMATSEAAQDLRELIQTLQKEYRNITVKEGGTHEYLGMLFEYLTPGVPGGRVRVTMEKYTKDVLEEAGVRTTADDPAASSLFDINGSSPVISSQDKELFHRTVAQLLYLATRTRPDILLPTIFLTTRVSVATKEDQRKLNRVLAYLNAEPHLGIHLGACEDGTLRLQCYADASFGVHPNGKSHSGMVLSLGRGPVLTKSVKQKIVVRSSTEAELVCLSDATSICAGHLNFLKTIGLDVQQATVHQDNMSTMRLAINGRSNSDRTKHIRLRYFFIKQYLDSGEFELVHCPTDIMVADILTKPLHGETFKRIRGLLLGHDSA